MKRVASLYLPEWPIDRLRRRDAAIATPPDLAAVDLSALVESGTAERARQCDAPRNSGWRPGARWARDDRADVDRRIAALPGHQRPPMREMGRRSEAAEHPFKTMPPDEGGAPSLPLFNGMPPVRRTGEGDRNAPVPYPGAERFFITGRMTGALVARVADQPEPNSAKRANFVDPPLVTAHKVDGAMLIAVACPAARALGLSPGMPLTQARAMTPGLDIREADPEGDRADLLALAFAAARRWTPLVAISGDDGLFLELTGAAHLHGGEEALARRIIRLLARLGVTARVAVADTPGAAWALARYGYSDTCNELLIADARHLRQLPVAALRLESRAVDLLKRLGVDTVGQLLALPRAPLVRRFGAAVAARIDQATGALPEPLAPVVPPDRIAVAQRFAEPIATPEAIEHWLGRLVHRLTIGLAEAGQGARAIELVADRIDGVPQRLRVGFSRPTRDPAHLLRLIVRRIEEIAPGYGIDALSLHIRRADPLGPEALGPALADETAPDLATLVDTLANRIGARGLWRTRPIESDIPERSVASRPPLDPPAQATPALRREDVRRLDARVPDHPWHPRWPRPVRLLRRPEALDHVIAEMPDHPPRRFTWRGVTYRVVRGDGPERIAGEWWKRTAERDAVRDYFQVEDEAGARFWLFRRGDGVRAETGDLSWFLHGAFA